MKFLLLTFLIDYILPIIKIMHHFVDKIAW